MVQVHKIGFFVVFGVFGLAGLMHATPSSSSSKYGVDFVEEDSSHKSSAQTYQVEAKKAETTQKAYQIQNDGMTRESSIKNYQSVTSHPVCQDLDGDGNACEDEPVGIDIDGDGTTGEQESQLGIENITDNQSVKILNNLGMGKNLSNFKTAGQTYRSGVLVESDEDEKDKSKLSQETSELEPSKSNARVLVS